MLRTGRCSSEAAAPQKASPQGLNLLNPSDPGVLLHMVELLLLCPQHTCICI